MQIDTHRNAILYISFIYSVWLAIAIRPISPLTNFHEATTKSTNMERAFIWVFPTWEMSSKSTVRWLDMFKAPTRTEWLCPDADLSLFTTWTSPSPTRNDKQQCLKFTTITRSTPRTCNPQRPQFRGLSYHCQWASLRSFWTPRTRHLIYFLQRSLTLVNQLE